MVSPPRDLLDTATSVNAVSISLNFLARGLSIAWEHGALPHDKSVALDTLRRANENLGTVIAQLEQMEVPCDV